MATEKVTPITGEMSSPPDDFGPIKDALNDCNALSSAATALDQSDGVDGCEIGSKARNTIHLCVKNLERLSNELDRWHVRHTHAPKELRS